MRTNSILAVLFFLFFTLPSHSQDNSSQGAIRVNQLGFLPHDSKTAIVFSNSKIKGKFKVIQAGSTQESFAGTITPSKYPGYGRYSYYYQLDFSAFKTPGTYFISIPGKKMKSVTFFIGDDAYKNYHEDLLGFMRQQRCGYNPFYDEVCHQQDGRAMDGPMPDSTYVDVSGGWHDAGDQLKYLITGSNATARMIMAYQFFPSKFEDNTNALGQPGGNGIPDVLDEARWGLEWILKLHPAKGQLFHQIADDRDHIGWKWLHEDKSNYGWGPNSYRVAYFATGKPQGLGKYKSEATGIANLAGRSAAALAMGYQVWKDIDQPFAMECLEAALDLYSMAKEKEGYQQGNSFGAPYRYNEDTWTDDMEWAASELYRVTKEPHYLQDALHYAKLTGTLSWMEIDTSAHYQYYPFVNVAHYSLYEFADESQKKELTEYYKKGIESTLQRARKNAYENGVPFIWCSNNLMVGLITQIILYEKMTGDQQYHRYMLGMRDWLFGRNPWGTSMFTNIPREGEYPQDVHTSTWALTKIEVPGGLIDGPIYASIFKNLMGLKLSQPDEFEAFQNNYVVYHDDIGDYSTNEPTMDGTAGAILMMAYFAK